MQLIGDHIYLRFLEESDAPSMLELHLRNRAFFEPYLVDRREEFYTMDYHVRSIAAGYALAAQDQKYSFGVFLSETDELIGNVSLTEIVRGPLQTCWMGYYLDRSQNGRGFATEAVRLVIDYAFEVLQLHRIEAGVMPRNAGSIRVLEKAGFKKEGLSKKNVLINGRWEDHLHFAIVNPNED
ncbi:GNAT family N-acetyltransferase [Alicyclobacillus fastidiosus]|uniref:GNAT family N-acetyltransferase n=1 Tax=Alicyclobacillus fastidiosus TaxID=392011 RepID=A0ABY6ZM40_9BACL|nr:GNAT family protein [Alicyclobacillus fastidiosus]WAH43922.1 GNAT family N-acetyltransferase [Alicyclobacillus fastidiosus]GMA60167.1 putative ribosomal-protein-alanine acetyltransferase [Alicyclobacillus fastidiosus]